MRTTPAPHRLITGLLATVLALLLPIAPALASGSGDVAAQDSTDAAPSLVLLMDSSGSMRDPDSAGQPKIEAARTALDSMITGLDPAEQVGFRVFGATVQGGENNPKACTDSQLVVPIGTDNRPALSAAVKDYQPKGDTPIGYALQQAAGDLGTDGNRTITLVSDGLATCDEDPCEIAADIAGQGIDLTIHVVGFDVDTQARQQLECIASAGRGTYYDADDTQSLTAALDRLATRAFKPFTIEGTPVQGTDTDNGAPELTPGGQYTDTLGAAEIPKHYLVERTMPGSSIHVGVSGLPPAGTTGQINTNLVTLDGEDCDWDYAETSPSAGTTSDVWRLLSAQVTAYRDGDEDDPCSQQDQLVLTVEMTAWQDEITGMPYEIVISEEPSPATDTLLPGVAEEPVWQEMPTTDPQPVTAGTSFNDASALEPGVTYSGELLTGETAFFTVPVEFGEALQAQATFPDPGPALSEQLNDLVTSKITMYSPHRGEASEPFPKNTELDDFEILRDDSRTQLGVMTSAVHWRNRDGGSTFGENVATKGDYYLVLSMSRDEDGESYLVPFELTVDTFSDGTGAPTYATSPDGDAGASSDAPPADSSSEPTEGGDGTETDATTDVEDDASGDPGTDDAAAEGDAAPSDADEVVPGAASAAGSDGVPTAVLISLGVVGLVVLTIGALGVFRVLSR